MLQMTYNHKESLEHLHRVGMLNTKGLDELIGLLRREKLDLEMKVMDVESKLQYKK